MKHHRESARPVEPVTMSSEAAAECLGVPTATVRTWLRNGVLTRVKIGGRALVSKPELDRIIAEQVGRSA